MMNKFLGSRVLSIILISSAILFTSSCKEELKDIDGNVYKTVKIGDQLWMAENLRVTRFNNGDPIETTDSVKMDISGMSEPKFQWIAGGKESYLELYGRLYTWYVVTDERKICPEGWHVITDTEWGNLCTMFGGKSKAGSKLRDGKNWAYSNVLSNNLSGFSAMPAGGRGANGAFGGMEHYGGWWSTSSKDSLIAPYWNIYYETEVVKRADYHKNAGFSVRCVKDL